MTAETVSVRLIRPDSGSPWGFRLQGGRDYLAPLIIGRITNGSIAERSGLREGDYLAEIAGVKADTLSHKEAQDAIISSGNNLNLLIERTSARIWAPAVTPVNMASGDRTSAPVKYSLAHDHPQASQGIGARYNSAARPFGQSSPSSAASRSTTFASNFQYNPPDSVYSTDNRAEAYRRAQGGLFGTDPNLNKPQDEPAYLKSATLKLIHESENGARSSSPIGGRRTPSPLPPVSSVPVDYSSLPNCDNCGRRIQGVFCKAGDKQLHAECFKCATCGTYLKNKGFFEHHGKIYCEIHSKQQSQNLFRATEPVDPNVFACRGAPLPISPHRPEPVKAFYQPDILKPGSVVSSFPKATTMSPQSRGVPTYSPKAKFTASDFDPYYQPQCGPGGAHCGSPAPPPDIGGGPRLKTASPIPTQKAFQHLKIGSSSGRSPTPTCAAVDRPVSPNVASNRGGTVGKCGGGAFQAPRRGRGILKQFSEASRVPHCRACNQEIRGPFVLALNDSWCPDHFVCSIQQCQRKLLDVGFVEENGKICCEFCYERYFAPTCTKCTRPIVAECVNALQKQWHPNCFTCAKCSNAIGNNAFFIENGQPICESDFAAFYTTKCASCQFPIETGDRYVDALGASFHSNCFTCTVCQTPLEGQSFYGKGNKPYCQVHV